MHACMPSFARTRKPLDRRRQEQPRFFVIAVARLQLGPEHQHAEDPHSDTAVPVTAIPLCGSEGTITVMVAGRPMSWPW
jgi:hypothetical protein